MWGRALSVSRWRSAASLCCSLVQYIPLLDASHPVSLSYTHAYTLPLSRILMPTLCLSLSYTHAYTLRLSYAHAYTLRLSHTLMPTLCLSLMYSCLHSASLSYTLSGCIRESSREKKRVGNVDWDLEYSRVKIFKLSLLRYASSEVRAHGITTNI